MSHTRMDAVSIAELARMLDVTVKTVRYAVSIGTIESPNYKPKGRRSYYTVAQAENIKKAWSRRYSPATK